MALLLSDTTKVLTREAEEKFKDYEYTQGILLRRFKLSPERFRMKFMDHQRNLEQTWREFKIQLNGYFEECIDWLKIVDFNSLTYFIVTVQLNRRVLYEIIDHFAHE